MLSKAKIKVMRMKLIRKVLCTFFAVVIATGVLVLIPQSDVEAAFKIDYEPHCDCIYMVNLDTGMVVYEKNADKVKYPASLTKMMTCLIALEYFSDPGSENVTISTAVMTDKVLIKNGVWSNGQLVEGERVSLKDLLYCAMLPSDNYAALAIATYVAEQKSPDGKGGVEWFVEKMNEKAREIGCENTLFMNPHGLFHEHHYSTAKDLFKIAQYAMNMPAFAEIVGETVYYRGQTNMHPTYADGKDRCRLENSNMMLSTAYEEYFYQYVKGIKTGYIGKSSHNFASYATKDGYSYICIALDDGATKNKDTNYAMLDCKAFYQWAFSNLALKEVVKANTAVTTVPIDLAWSRDTVELYPAESYTTLMLANIEPSSIMVKTDLPETIQAPIKKGERLGTAQLVYGSEVIGTVELVAGETIQRNELLYLFSLISNMFDSTVFVVLLALLALIAVAYVGYSLLHARNVSSLKKVHRYRRM